MHACDSGARSSFGRSMLDPFFRFSSCNLQATDLCYHLFEPLVGISRSTEAFIAGRLPPRVCPTALNFTHAVIRERLRSGVSLLPKALRRHIKFPGRAAPRERRIQVLGSIHERPSPKSQPPNRKRRSSALNFRLRKSSKAPPWQPGGADFEIPTPRRHDMMCT